MSLIHESIIRYCDYIPGDIKLVGYNIPFTLHTLTTPSQDPGWLLLNGATITIGAYPILYARFGSTLPDFTDGKVPIPKGLTKFTSFGASSGQGEQGGGGGEFTHAVTNTESPSHYHSDNFAISVGSHSHSGSQSCSGPLPDDSHYHITVAAGTSGDGASSGTIGGTVYTSVANTTTSSNAHNHSFSGTIASASSGRINTGGTIANFGSGTAHENKQPYQVFGGWLVKAG